MVSKRRRLMALVLAVMTLLSVIAVGTFSTSAASGDTVYCENAAGWSDVYCYMWSDGSGNNHEWPGVKMTKGDGNTWSYSVSGDWNMIIFNSGSDANKTGDLTYPGNGKCYNNSNGSWTDFSGPTPTTPNPGPTPTTPNPGPTPSGDNVVYLKDSAGWGNIHVYMWNSDADKNAAWPGEKATDLGDGVWEYRYSKAYSKIIFNVGSDATQTDDLTFPGGGQIYDNSTGSWSLYDTSKLHIKSFTADVASPQYTGVKINLAAVAGGGEGDLSYQFSVGSTVISEYSSTSSVSWTPAKAGSYTVKVEVKDTLGETVSKTMTYEIKDIATEVKPVIQNVKATPSNFENTQLEKGKEATVDILAGGGNTGTKLLFYKVTITDPSGETVNVPYYSLKNAVKFTPKTEGKYSITASVEASDNSFTTRTVEYNCVKELSEPGELSVSVDSKKASEGVYTITASAAGGAGSYTYQFALNGKTVQEYSSKATYTLNAAEAGNYTVEVTVKDASGKTAKASTSVQVAGKDDPQPSVPTTTVPDPQPTVAPENLTLTFDTQDKGNGVFKFVAEAAGGAGDYQYEFEANGAVVQKYSSKNSVSLNLSADGAYTIKVTAKDAKGATVSKETTLYIQNGEVSIPTRPSDPAEELSSTITVTKDSENYIVATAQGVGGTGDYQYQFAVNGTVYQKYSEKNTFKCQLPYDGDYTIEVFVKDSAGTSVSKPKDFAIVGGEIQFETTPPTTVPTKPTEKPTVKPTNPGDLEVTLKGDADCNGKVNVKDATLIQKHVAKISTLTDQGFVNAEVDGNGKVNVKDATMIQKFIANMIEW